VRAYGPATLEDLRRSFAANGFSIRKLAVEIIAVSAFVGRDANAAEVTSIRP
jgi:hypothetical protein